MHAGNTRRSPERILSGYRSGEAVATYRLCFISLLAAGSMVCSSASTPLEGVKCSIVETRPVSPDEATPAGTAGELVESLSQNRSSLLRWFGRAGTTLKYVDTPLAFHAVADVTKAQYQKRMPSGSVNGLCPDVLIVETEFRLETADGTFADSFAGFASQAGGVVTFEGSRSAVPLEGSYDDTWLMPFKPTASYNVSAELVPSVRGNVFFFWQRMSDDPNTIPTPTMVAEWPAVTN